ncbi:MAG: hypothetical protein Q8R48_07150, partial [Candidatus Omnitrophota bacterium]|nr:hypothetical protein [Candidatus Omnitrophota bacterium]
KGDINAYLAAETNAATKAKVLEALGRISTTKVIEALINFIDTETDTAFITTAAQSLDLIATALNAEAKYSVQLVRPDVMDKIAAALGEAAGLDGLELGNGGLILILYPQALHSVEVTREASNPILQPADGAGHEWENKHVLNPAAFYYDSKYYILYRAVGDDNISRIGLAVSDDGVNITRRLDGPILSPNGMIPEELGVEDPRAVIIEGTLYITYTAVTAALWQPAMASMPIAQFIENIEDPANAEWTWDKSLMCNDGICNKDAVIFSQKISGKYAALYRQSIDNGEETIYNGIQFAFSDTDDVKGPYTTDVKDILEPRPGMWDSHHIGVAAPPIETEDGWLVFYHGADNSIEDGGVYRVGYVILDKEDPTKVLYRSLEPLMEPEAPYETNPAGRWVPNVIFPAGAVIEGGGNILKSGDTVIIYYGAADHTVAAAKMVYTKQDSTYILSSGKSTDGLIHAIGDADQEAVDESVMNAIAANAVELIISEMPFSAAEKASAFERFKDIISGIIGTIKTTTVDVTNSILERLKTIFGPRNDTAEAEGSAESALSRLLDSFASRLQLSLRAVQGAVSVTTALTLAAAIVLGLVLVVPNFADNAISKNIISIAAGENDPRQLISSMAAYGDAGTTIISNEQAHLGINSLKFKNEGTTNKWASAAGDLVKPYDASGYKYMTFWVKGALGGEKLLLIGRDSHAKGYMPQMKIDVTKYIEGGAITTSWKQVRIPVKDLPIDITAIAQLGFEFGADTAGNAQGATMYVDNIDFESNGIPAAAAGPATPSQTLDTNIYNKIVQAEQASGTEPQAVPVTASVAWLSQHMSSHGLIQEFAPGTNTVWPTGNRSYIYPNSVAIGAFVDANEIAKAKKTADAMVQRQQADGSWYTDYDYFTGEKMGNNRASTGEVGFLGMQMFKLYKVTGDAKYLSSATKAANWIKQFQMLDPKSSRYGAVTMGFDQNGKLLPYSPTENNAEILSLYYYLGKETNDAELLARGKLIADWLVRPTEEGGMWHVKEKYFHVGLSDLKGTLSPFDEPSDAQALTLMVLQATQDLHGHNPADYKDSLKWLLSFMKTVSYQGKTVKGFSVKPWKNAASIDISIVQYYIHAARSMGENDLADYFQKEIDKLRNASGMLPWMVATDTELKWPFNMPYVHPLTVGMDLMRTNFYILSDTVKAKPIMDKNKIDSKINLLNRLGATNTMLDDREKLEEYAKSLADSVSPDDQDLAVLLRELVAILPEKTQPELAGGDDLLADIAERYDTWLADNSTTTDRDKFDMMVEIFCEEVTGYRKETESRGSIAVVPATLLYDAALNTIFTGKTLSDSEQERISDLLAKNQFDLLGYHIIYSMADTAYETSLAETPGETGNITQLLDLRASANNNLTALEDSIYSQLYKPHSYEMIDTIRFDIDRGVTPAGWTAAEYLDGAVVLLKDAAGREDIIIVRSGITMAQLTMENMNPIISSLKTSLSEGIVIVQECDDTSIISQDRKEAGIKFALGLYVLLSGTKSLRGRDLMKTGFYQYTTADGFIMSYNSLEIDEVTDPVGDTYAPVEADVTPAYVEAINELAAKESDGAVLAAAETRLLSQAIAALNAANLHTETSFFTMSQAAMDKVTAVLDVSSPADSRTGHKGFTLENGIILIVEGSDLTVFREEYDHADFDSTFARDWGSDEDPAMYRDYTEYSSMWVNTVSNIKEALRYLELMPTNARGETETKLWALKNLFNMYSQVTAQSGLNLKQKATILKQARGRLARYEMIANSGGVYTFGVGEDAEFNTLKAILEVSDTWIEMENPAFKGLPSSIGSFQRLRVEAYRAYDLNITPGLLDAIALNGADTIIGGYVFNRNADNTYTVYSPVGEVVFRNQDITPDLDTLKEENPLIAAYLDRDNTYAVNIDENFITRYSANIGWFITRLKEGSTAGTRGILDLNNIAGGSELNLAVIAMLAQAYANYVNKNFPADQRKVFVGFDERHYSREFAELVTRILAGNGITVIRDKDGLATATPVTSYMSYFNLAAGGIELTASHNPANQTGLKSSTSYGGVDTDDVSDKVAAEAELLYNNGLGSGKINIAERGGIQEIDAKAVYYENYFKRLYPKETIDTIKTALDSGAKFIFDGLAGVGGPTMEYYLTRLFNDYGYEGYNWQDKIIIMNKDADPDILGIAKPDPSDPSTLEYSGVLEKLIEEGGVLLSVTADMDADRIGTAVIIPDEYIAQAKADGLFVSQMTHNGQTVNIVRFTANQIFTLILYERILQAFEYLIGTRDDTAIMEAIANGSVDASKLHMMTSIPTSMIAKLLMDKYYGTSHLTAVGFKNLGYEAQKADGEDLEAIVLMLMEESGGAVIGPIGERDDRGASSHRDKDTCVLALALFATASQLYNQAQRKNLVDFYHEMTQKIGQYLYYERVDAYLPTKKLSESRNPEDMKTANAVKKAVLEKMERLEEVSTQAGLENLVTLFGRQPEDIANTEDVPVSNTMLLEKDPETGEWSRRAPMAKRINFNDGEAIEIYHAGEGPKITLYDSEGRIKGWTLIRPSGTESLVRVYMEVLESLDNPHPENLYGYFAALIKYLGIDAYSLEAGKDDYLTKHKKNVIEKYINSADTLLDIISDPPEGQSVKDAAIAALNNLPRGEHVLNNGVHAVSQELLREIAVKAMGAIEEYTVGMKSLALKSGVILIRNDLEGDAREAEIIRAAGIAAADALYADPATTSMITDAVNDMVAAFGSIDYIAESMLYIPTRDSGKEPIPANGEPDLYHIRVLKELMAQWNSMQYLFARGKILPGTPEYDMLVVITSAFSNKVNIYGLNVEVNKRRISGLGSLGSPEAINILLNMLGSSAYSPQTNALADALNNMPQRGYFLERGIWFTSGVALEKIATSLGVPVPDPASINGLTLKSGLVLIKKGMTGIENNAVFHHELDHLVINHIYSTEETRHFVTDVTAVLTDADVESLRIATNSSADKSAEEIADPALYKIRILNEAMGTWDMLKYRWEMAGTLTPTEHIALDRIEGILNNETERPEVYVPIQALVTEIGRVITEEDLLNPGLLAAIASSDQEAVSDEVYEARINAAIENNDIRKLRNAYLQVKGLPFEQAAKHLIHIWLGTNYFDDRTRELNESIEVEFNYYSTFDKERYNRILFEALAANKSKFSSQLVADVLNDDKMISRVIFNSINAEELKTLLNDSREYSMQSVNYEGENLLILSGDSESEVYYTPFIYSGKTLVKRDGHSHADSTSLTISGQDTFAAEARFDAYGIYPFTILVNPSGEFDLAVFNGTDWDYYAGDAEAIPVLQSMGIIFTTANKVDVTGMTGEEKISEQALEDFIQGQTFANAVSLDEQGRAIDKFGFESEQGGIFGDAAAAERAAIIAWWQAETQNGARMLWHDGIGGQALGNRAVIEPSGVQDGYEVQVVEKLGFDFVQKFDELIAKGFKASDMRIHASSKSGTTDETMIDFQTNIYWLAIYLAREVGISEDDAKSAMAKLEAVETFDNPLDLTETERAILTAVFERIVFTTTPNVEKSAIYRLAISPLAHDILGRDITTFSIPDNIGGRFSERSQSGDISSITAGRDITKIYEGAKEDLPIYKSTNAEVNPAMKAAALLHMDDPDYLVIAVQNSTQAAEALALAQKFPESWGKNGVGPFVYVVIGNEALNEMAALPGKKAFLIINVESDNGYTPEQLALTPENQNNLYIIYTQKDLSEEEDGKRLLFADEFTKWVGLFNAAQFTNDITSAEYKKYDWQLQPFVQLGKIALVETATALDRTSEAREGRYAELEQKVENGPLVDEVSLFEPVNDTEPALTRTIDHFKAGDVIEYTENGTLYKGTVQSVSGVTVTALLMFDAEKAPVVKSFNYKTPNAVITAHKLSDAEKAAKLASMEALIDEAVAATASETSDIDDAAFLVKIGEIEALRKQIMDLKAKDGVSRMEEVAALDAQLKALLDEIANYGQGEQSADLEATAEMLAKLHFMNMEDGKNPLLTMYSPDEEADVAGIFWKYLAPELMNEYAIGTRDQHSHFQTDLDGKYVLLMGLVDFVKSYATIQSDEHDVINTYGLASGFLDGLYRDEVRRLFLEAEARRGFSFVGRNSYILRAKDIQTNAGKVEFYRLIGRVNQLVKAMKIESLEAKLADTHSDAEAIKEASASLAALTGKTQVEIILDT